MLLPANAPFGLWSFVSLRLIFANLHLPASPSCCLPACLPACWVTTVVVGAARHDDDDDDGRGRTTRRRKRSRGATTIREMGRAARASGHARTPGERAGGRALSFKFPTKRHAYGGVSVVVVGRGADPLLAWRTDGVSLVERRLSVRQSRVTGHGPPGGVKKTRPPGLLRTCYDVLDAKPRLGRP